MRNCVEASPEICVPPLMVVLDPEPPEDTFCTPPLLMVVPAAAPPSREADDSPPGPRIRCSMDGGRSV